MPPKKPPFTPGKPPAAPPPYPKGKVAPMPKVPLKDSMARRLKK